MLIVIFVILAVDVSLLQNAILNNLENKTSLNEDDIYCFLFKT